MIAEQARGHPGIYVSFYTTPWGQEPLETSTLEQRLLAVLQLLGSASLCPKRLAASATRR